MIFSGSSKLYSNVHGFAIVCCDNFNILRYSNEKEGTHISVAMNRFSSFINDHELIDLCFSGAEQDFIGEH